MDVEVTNWFDVLICVIVLLGLFGVLASLIFYYDKRHHWESILNRNFVQRSTSDNVVNSSNKDINQLFQIVAHQMMITVFFSSSVNHLSFASGVRGLFRQSCVSAVRGPFRSLRSLKRTNYPSFASGARGPFRSLCLLKRTNYRPGLMHHISKPDKIH